MSNAIENKNSFEEADTMSNNGVPADNTMKTATTTTSATKMEHVIPKKTFTNSFEEADTMSNDGVPADTTTTTTTTTSAAKTEQTKPQKTFTKRQVGGAAAVGGIVGLIVAGPVIAVAVGIGVAVAATTKGKVGDVARASGDVVASAGDRLKHLDEKHQVTQTTSKVFVKGCKTVSKTLKPKETPSSTAQPGSANA